MYSTAMPCLLVRHRRPSLLIFGCAHRAVQILLQNGIVLEIRSRRREGPDHRTKGLHELIGGPVLTLRLLRRIVDPHAHAMIQHLLTDIGIGVPQVGDAVQRQEADGTFGRSRQSVGAGIDGVQKSELRIRIQLSFRQDAEVESFFECLFGLLQKKLEGTQVVGVGFACSVGCHLDWDEAALTEEEFRDWIVFELLPVNNLDRALVGTAQLEILGQKEKDIEHAGMIADPDRWRLAVLMIGGTCALDLTEWNDPKQPPRAELRRRQRPTLPPRLGYERAQQLLRQQGDGQGHAHGGDE
mmetsp:Transcript_23682/g.66145  ORF Transcript_23682/g.66145 Transcript_23682/m.66145 type:complete len:298 (+) Transcript_23682:39-932(+)